MAQGHCGRYGGIHGEELADALSDQPSQQLFWKFAQKPLLDWRQMAAPTGTDESTARTITIQADVNYGGKTRTYEYDALVLCEDGKWAVDPDSLSTGVLVEAATPTPRIPTLRRRPRRNPRRPRRPARRPSFITTRAAASSIMRIKTARRSRASICR